MIEHYRQCVRCIMDTTAAGIAFDRDGRCSYCKAFEGRLLTYQPQDAGELLRRSGALIEQVKRDGRGKKYDCVIGVSGGADSGYALYEAKRLGLRPLAVHMDNGWDSELAASNIQNLVRTLDVDLHTHVINWVEYRQLMLAFFDADVLDVELLYDNAMLAVNYQTAGRYGIRWILSGENTTTEGMQMPPNWSWFKFDKKNILSIANQRKVRLKTFPAIGTLDYIRHRMLNRTRWIRFLDYVDYFKPRCMDILVKEVGFRPYPYKHYESVFTRFYQGYILPKKFNVDKRKLHLSTLIISGQLTRDEALVTMVESPYPSAGDLEDDTTYFVKKVGWTRKELEEYIARPEVPHAAYGTEKPLWDRASRLARHAGLLDRADT